MCHLQNGALSFGGPSFLFSPNHIHDHLLASCSSSPAHLVLNSKAEGRMGMVVIRRMGLVGNYGRSSMTQCLFPQDLSGWVEGGRCVGEPNLFWPGCTFHSRVRWEPKKTQNALSLWVWRVKDIGNRFRGLIVWLVQVVSVGWFVVWKLIWIVLLDFFF